MRPLPPSRRRLPNVNELQSLVNYGVIAPAVAAPFGSGCGAGCDVAACSCTAPTASWTSTTFLVDPSLALGVDFATGFVTAHDKDAALTVRAVRGGGERRLRSAPAVR